MLDEKEIKNVILYTIPDCPKCANLKKRLSQKGISYDLCEMGEEKVMEMLERGFSSAPILDINGHKMIYKEALKWVAEV